MKKLLLIAFLAILASTAVSQLEAFFIGAGPVGVGVGVGPYWGSPYWGGPYWGGSYLGGHRWHHHGSWRHR